MDLYAENILDHYHHPHHKLPLPLGEGWGEGRVVREEKNVSCGDKLTVALLIEDNHLTNIAWTGEGCAISQAAMSMLSDELIGKSLTEINALTPKTILALLNVPIGTRRMKCALLGLEAVKNAISMWSR